MNIYYYKLGFKPVPKIKPKSYDIKKIFEEEKLNEMNDFQKKRLAGLDEIERLMNEITPLVSNAKNDTIELYGGNAGSYDITQPIEIVKNYLQEIKELFQMMNNLKHNAIILDIEQGVNHDDGQNEWVIRRIAGYDSKK